MKQDGNALFSVRNQTEEICLEAVKQNGHALCFVNNQTEEICEIAINNPVFFNNHGDAEVFLQMRILGWIRDSKMKKRFAIKYNQKPLWPME